MCIFPTTLARKAVSLCAAPGCSIAGPPLCNVASAPVIHASSAPLCQGLRSTAANFSKLRSTAGLIYSWRGRTAQAARSGQQASRTAGQARPAPRQTVSSANPEIRWRVPLTSAVVSANMRSMVASDQGPARSSAQRCAAPLLKRGSCHMRL